MRLFELSPNDRLNYNGQIYHYLQDTVDEEEKPFRVYKRHHDGKRAVFYENKEVVLLDEDVGGILYYKLKNIQ